MPAGLISRGVDEVTRGFVLRPGTDQCGMDGQSTENKREEQQFFHNEGVLGILITHQMKSGLVHTVNGKSCRSEAVGASCCPRASGREAAKHE